MPSLPDPPDDPLDNRAWIDKQADRVAISAGRELRRIITRAYEAFLNTLTATGDFSAFDAIPVEWGVYVGEQLLDDIDQTYRTGAVAAWNQAPTTVALGADLAAAWSAIVNEDALTYAAQASNRLAGVGNDVWRQVNSEVVASIQRGESTEVLKSTLERLTSFSEFRADTIARTEIGSAFVNGNYDAQVALGDYGPQFKEWLAVGDARTRAEHLDVNGTIVEFDDVFIVGGESMRAPLDDGASAANVVNCRCDVLYYYFGDTLPDGTVVTVTSAEMDAAEGGEEIPDEA